MGGHHHCASPNQLDHLVGKAWVFTSAKNILGDIHNTAKWGNRTYGVDFTPINN